MYVKPWIKEIERIGGQQGRSGFLRLDMNENPGGLPEEFVEGVKRELTPECLAMYPEESRCLNLLADYLTAESGMAKGSLGRERQAGAAAPEERAQEKSASGAIGPENLCLTNGSDMAIRYLFEVYAEKGSTVVTVAPSFEMYRIYSLVFGLNHRPVLYHEDFTLPVEEILDAIREDTDIVVLLNPNNPIGRAYTDGEFEAITDKAANVGALVIVDEAYHYFYKKTFLREALEKNHVVVIRTFSKLMSMAGCRMGFMVADPQLIEYVRHVRPSFEVNTVALKLGEKLLERPELIDRMQQEAEEGKRHLLNSLKNAGYDVMEREGNFIFVRPKFRAAKEVAERLEHEKQVLVKTYGAPLLKDYLRISTGARYYMEQFLEVFYEVDCR